MNYVCLMFAAPALCAVFILLHNFVQIQTSEPVSTVILDRTAVVKSLLSKAAGAGLCVMLCVGLGHAQCPLKAPNEYTHCNGSNVVLDALGSLLHVTSLNHEDFSDVAQDDCSHSFCTTYIDTVKGYITLNKNTVRRLTLQCKAQFLLGEKTTITFTKCWALSAGEDVLLGMLLDGKALDRGSVAPYTILRDVECPREVTK